MEFVQLEVHPTSNDIFFVRMQAGRVNLRWNRKFTNFFKPIDTYRLLPFTIYYKTKSCSINIRLTMQKPKSVTKKGPNGEITRRMRVPSFPPHTTIISAETQSLNYLIFVIHKLVGILLSD